MNLTTEAPEILHFLTWYGMQSQSFLGSFGGTTRRSTNKAHYDSPNYNLNPEMQLIFTIKESLKSLMHL